MPRYYRTNLKVCLLFYQNRHNPNILDRGNEIILAYWPDDKHIICYVNNDIPVKIPSHPYVLVNRSVLCNCRIEVKITFFGISSCMP